MITHVILGHKSPETIKQTLLRTVNVYNNKSVKERQLFDAELATASSDCSTCALTQDKKKGSAGINRRAKITNYRRSLNINMNNIAEKIFAHTKQRYEKLVAKFKGSKGEFNMEQPERTSTEEEKIDFKSKSK